MSSIIIKNMEMPKNCAECKMWSICDCLKEFDDYESLLYAVDDGDWVIADDCPLVEIPTPHGRLGDLDELYKAANMADDFGADTTDILKLIIDTPTVIEAEGSEE